MKASATADPMGGQRVLRAERDRSDLGLSWLPHEESAGHRTAGASGHHSCRAGWLGEDADRQPVPCLVCRPWLASAVSASREALD